MVELRLTPSSTSDYTIYCVIMLNEYAYANFIIIILILLLLLFLLLLLLLIIIISGTHTIVWQSCLATMLEIFVLILWQFTNEIFFSGFRHMLKKIVWKKKTEADSSLENRRISVRSIKVVFKSLGLFLLSTYANYQRRVPRTILFNFLDDLGSRNIQCRTLSLVIRCFHEKCPMDRRHLWSNT